MNKWILYTSPINTTTMYTIIRLSCIIFMMTFILTSCDKVPLEVCAEDPSCEYFRCKVNGEWWTPDCEEGPLFGCRHTDVQYYKDLGNGSLEMGTTSKESKDGLYFLLVNIKDKNLQNSYMINNNKIFTKYFNSSNMFYVDTTKYNEFILTQLDTMDYIISARFSFTGVDENGNTVSITDGEFRQHYRF